MKPALSLARLPPSDLAKQLDANGEMVAVHRQRNTDRQIDEQMLERFVSLNLSEQINKILK